MYRERNGQRERESQRERDREREREMSKHVERRRGMPRDSDMYTEPIRSLDIYIYIYMYIYIYYIQLYIASLAPTLISKTTVIGCTNKQSC